MKKIMTNFRCMGVFVVLAVAMFPMVSLAALTVSAPVPSNVSVSGASLSAQVSNPWKTTMSWFEWGETPSLGYATNLSSIWHQGFFYGTLEGLKPNTTYYYRAVAMEGVERVESPTLSFVTRALPVAPPLAVPAKVEPQPTPKPIPSKASVEKVATKEPAKEMAVKNTDTSKDTLTIKWRDDRSMASVFGAGDGIFPDTLVGWVLLIVVFLLMVLIMRMIFESNQKRALVHPKYEIEEHELHEQKLEVPLPPRG